MSNQSFRNVLYRQICRFKRTEVINSTGSTRSTLISKPVLKRPLSVVQPAFNNGSGSPGTEQNMVEQMPLKQVSSEQVEEDKGNPIAI